MTTETTAAPACADDAILVTEGLTKEFKGFVAVDDVNLQIQRGHIHALIGPNGAGKTTVFNLLTHFLPPTRGRIVYNGTEITGNKPAQIARKGVLPQGITFDAGGSTLAVSSFQHDDREGGSVSFWRLEDGELSPVGERITMPRGVHFLMALPPVLQEYGYSDSAVTLPIAAHAVLTRTETMVLAQKRADGFGVLLFQGAPGGIDRGQRLQQCEQAFAQLLMVADNSMDLGVRGYQRRVDIVLLCGIL